MQKVQSTTLRSNSGLPDRPPEPPVHVYPITPAALPIVDRSPADLVQIEVEDLIAAHGEHATRIGIERAIARRAAR